jgi:hypothetical protein
MIVRRLQMIFEPSSIFCQTVARRVSRRFSWSSMPVSRVIRARGTAPALVPNAL